MILPSLRRFFRAYGCLVTGLLLVVDASAQAPEQPDLPVDELRRFVTVFDHIRQSYVDDIDDATLLHDAVRGMMLQLDPHSSYLDEQAFAEIQTRIRGRFAGLGLEVTLRDDGLINVVTPLDDTPAQQAGVKSGDVIIMLDKQSVRGLSLTEVVELMRGESGTDITLAVRRPPFDQPLEFVITRAMIDVQSVRSAWLEPGYGYIRIAEFQEKTGRDFNEAVQRFVAKEASLKGLVLDLRNNPGGILQSAVHVVDSLIEQGVVVYTEGRLAEANAIFSASVEPTLTDVPLVVLINEGSASAAEIVAGALQDHRRAVVLGRPSFGKGSVQTILPIGNDEAIKLTTARYYTPSGHSIQAQGIVPDVLVDHHRLVALSGDDPMTEADLRGHLVREPVLPLDAQRDSKNSDELLGITHDYPVQQALNILKGFYILNGMLAT